ncbi:Histone_H3 [Hexamita inflata]|uniref:Histone_H3 n=1 Tax=Hexamita inflata TaxID=28002 RepID=A0ABP1GJN3_9EUKA
MIVGHCKNGKRRFLGMEQSRTSSPPQIRMARVKHYITKSVRKTKAKESLVVSRNSVPHSRARVSSCRVSPKQLQSSPKPQSAFKHAISGSSFQKLVQSLVVECGLAYRMQRTAVDVLHSAAEALLSQILSDSQLVAQHSGRATTRASDVRLQMRIAKQSWAGCLK